MKRILATIVASFAISMTIQAQWTPIPDSLIVGESKYEVCYVDTLIDYGTQVRLRTQMCLPVTEEQVPVVVMRIPYLPENFNISMLPQPKQYAERGMGYIIQNCRGTGGSEGVFRPNVDERRDGLALLQWIEKQEWISAVGMTGTSYMSLACWIVADSLPSKVKAIHTHHYGVDRHLSAYNSGLFRQDILTAWSIDNAKEPINKPAKDKSAPYYEQERYMPQITMDVDKLGCELPWYRDWITHTDYNDQYWHQGVWETLRSVPPKVTVPMTIVAGHYDHHNEGTILGYQMLNSATKSKSRLIVGAWNHSFVTTPTIHSPNHDKDINIDADAINWLYSILVENEQPSPEILVYSIGEDCWHRMDQWPIEKSKCMTLYLSGEKEGRNVRWLADEGFPIADQDTVTFVYDPQNPVMSVGGETLFTSEETRGSIVQPQPGYRDDVITYISAPMEENVTIDGKIKAVIWMSTDVDDTSLSFKVSEILPDGTSVNIRSGITTLAYRNDRLGNRQIYSPGDVEELTIETLPIMWQVKRGHRIRVDITSSNFPEYAIHSNYAGIWSLQSKARKANQTIYYGKKRPSRIILPLE